jgi:hypothetical protein
MPDRKHVTDLIARVDQKISREFAPERLLTASAGGMTVGRTTLWRKKDDSSLYDEAGLLAHMKAKDASFAREYRIAMLAKKTGFAR